MVKQNTESIFDEQSKKMIQDQVDKLNAMRGDGAAAISVEAVEELEKNGNNTALSAIGLLGQVLAGGTTSRVVGANAVARAGADDNLQDIANNKTNQESNLTPEQQMFDDGDGIWTASDQQTLDDHKEDVAENDKAALKFALAGVGAMAGVGILTALEGAEVVGDPSVLDIGYLSNDCPDCRDKTTMLGVLA